MANLPENFDLGENIHELRKGRGLSLEELAKISGVSKAMLSQIEQQKVNPSIGIVWKIARGLNISIQDLFSSHDEDEIVFEVIHAESSPNLINVSETCRMQIISKMDMIDENELYLLHFKPRGELDSKPHFPRTMEITTAIKGELEIITDQKRAVIKPYDTVYYSADCHHCIRNLTDEPAQAYVVTLFNRPGKSTNL